MPPRQEGPGRYGANDIGALGPGNRGDLVVLDAPAPAHLAYRPGVDIVATVVRAGQVISSSPSVLA